MVRFIATGTVEERILELQKRKQILCATALGSGADGAGEKCSRDEARRLRLADLRLCVLRARQENLTVHRYLLGIPTRHGAPGLREAV